MKYLIKKHIDLIVCINVYLSNFLNNRCPVCKIKKQIKDFGFFACSEKCYKKL